MLPLHKPLSFAENRNQILNGVQSWVDKPKEECCRYYNAGLPDNVSAGRPSRSSGQGRNTGIGQATGAEAK